MFSHTCHSCFYQVPTTPHVLWHVLLLFRAYKSTLHRWSNKTFIKTPITNCKCSFSKNSFRTSRQLLGGPRRGPSLARGGYAHVRSVIVPKSRTIIYFYSKKFTYTALFSSQIVKLYSFPAFSTFLRRACHSRSYHLAAYFTTHPVAV